MGSAPPGWAQRAKERDRGGGAGQGQDRWGARGETFSMGSFKGGEKKWVEQIMKTIKARGSSGVVTSPGGKVWNRVPPSQSGYKELRKSAVSHIFSGTSEELGIVTEHRRPFRV